MSNSGEPENDLWPSTASTPASAAEILLEFNVLKRESKEEFPMGKDIADVFLAVVQIPENASACISRLFPDGVPLDHSFFERLSEIRDLIGVAESADEAIGILWSGALRQQIPENQLKLLEVFAAQEGHDFFEFARSLDVVLRSLSLPAAFAADWFTNLVRIVEGDIAVDVWSSIKTYCENNPDSAVQVIWKLTEPVDDRRLNIAGVMLGTLRLLSLVGEQEASFKRVESFFENHADEQLRAVYNWSCATTARVVGISDTQLHALFTRADSGTSGDLGSVMSVICRLCHNDKLPTESRSMCVDWIDNRVNPSLDANAKFNVADVALHLIKKSKGDQLQKIDVSSWIVRIQPVDIRDLGTWNEVEYLLNHLAENDPESFRQVFKRLCDVSGGTIHKLMRDSRRFGFLLHQPERLDLDEVTGQLAMSSDRSLRRFGLFLFDNLGIKTLTDGSFASNGGLGMQLLFYELQLTILAPQALARLFVSMLKHTSLVGEQFKNDLLDELHLQSRNFSGGCRDELKVCGADIPDVQAVLSSVDEYFEMLKTAREAGVNAMEVPGHSRAEMLYRRRFSLTVSEGAKKHSPIFGLFKHVSLLYGKSSSMIIEGRLSKAMPLHSVSTSMEIPVIDFCDPEEMALRRIYAGAAIQRLLKTAGRVLDGDDE